MAFMIGGHPRSGTTMLFRLCNHHPAIGITGEFKCFRRLGARLPTYFTGLEKKWYVKSFVSRIGRHEHWIFRAQSGLFLAEYLGLMSLQVRGGKVLLGDVEKTLQRIHRKTVVGDKYPRYVFRLDRYCRLSGLKRIMIYRDGRDVVSSFLQKVRTSWKNLPVAKTENNARRIAERWVESMENIERNRDACFVIRYEEFVCNPSPVTTAMADYLGVAPAGFQTGGINDRSIGKYQTGLTPEELSDVMAVAGSTLARLEYL